MNFCDLSSICYFGKLNKQNNISSSGHCNKEYVATVGTVNNITSPNYPDSYPSNVNACITTIHTDHSQAVLYLNFVEFDVEDSDTCNYDYLEVCVNGEVVMFVLYMSILNNNKKNDVKWTINVRFDLEFMSL